MVQNARYAVTYQPSTSVLKSKHSAYARNVIFSACVDTGATCLDDAVIVRAQVNFQQAATGLVTKTSVQSWSVNR